MSEAIRSLVYFQRLCLLYERGSSKVLSLFRYITCAEYTHFYGGKKPGETWNPSVPFESVGVVKGWCLPCRE